MRRTLYINVISILSIFLISLPGWVEDTAPVDPIGSDVNLTKLVSYQARGVSIGNAVDALAKAAGLNLRAGTSSKDWEVRDRKVNIFVNKLPLSELMNSLSRVTGFKWQIIGESTDKTYRLVWDSKSKAEAQAAINKPSETSQVSGNQQVSAEPVDLEFYPGFGNTAPLTPQQKANLDLTDPFLAWWEKSGMAKAVGGVMGNVQGVAGAISSGSKTSITGDQLTVQGQKAIKKFLGRANQNGKILGGVQGRGALRNIRNNLGDAKISVNQSVSAGAFGSISVSYGKWSISAPLIDPKSATAATIGKIYTQNKQTGRKANARQKNQKGDLLRATDADASAIASANERAVGAEDGTRPGASTTADTQKPAQAQAKGTFKASNKPLSMELMRASKLLNVSIVSDWYGDPSPVSNSSESASSKPEDVLDDIADRYDYTWNKPAEVSEFMDEDSAEKSFLTLPDEFLAGFRKIFIESGKLELNDLLQLSNLSQGQIDVGIESDEILGKSGISKIFEKNGDILRLLKTLDENERARVFTQGINLKELAPEKIPLAKTAVAQRPKYLERNDIPLVLKGQVSQEGKASVYQIVVSLDNGDKQSLKWILKTPVYNPKQNRLIESVGPKISAVKAKQTTSNAGGK